MSNKIRIDLPNESFLVEIKGEQPTVSEKIKIADLIRNRQRASQQNINFRSATEQEGFDTKSGIPNAKLRAFLSTAENSAEQENILNKAGFAVDDYTRDKRGRLALNPSGAKKLGIETEKPILIDEEGFSRYDFADLAGISPELTLGVAGAIAGTAAIPIPLLGTIIGGAAGASTGSLLEEAVEGIAGVSEQSAGEIVKEALVEGAITGASELFFGAPLLVLRGITKGVTPGVVREGGEELRLAGEAIEEGYAPSLTQIGGPPVAAKLEQTTENLIGYSKRMEVNQNRMREDLDKLRQFIDESDKEIESVGGKVVSAAKSESKRLKDLETQAFTSVTRALRQAVETSELGIKQNKNLDEKVISFIEDAAKQFNDQATQNYRVIDDIIETPVGTTSIIPTNPIKEVADDLKKSYETGRVIGDPPERGATLRLVNQIESLGDTISFKDLYKSIGLVSKEMRDNLAQGSSTYMGNLRLIRNTLDSMLDVENLNSLPSAQIASIGDEGFEALKNAAKQVKPSRDFYKSGVDDIEKIEDAIGIKNIVRKVKSGEGLEVVQGTLQKLVKNNNPRPLQDLKFAVGQDNFGQIRNLLSSQFLFDAVRKSGLDSTDPSLFRSSVFKKQIEDLGETAKELFGDNLPKIKNLANKIDSVGNGFKIDQETINRAILSGFEEQGDVVRSLENALRATNEIAVAKRNGVLRNIAEGQVSPDEAAQAIASTSTSAEDFKLIFNALDDEGKNTVKSYFMRNMLEGFGPTSESAKLKELAKRIKDGNKNNRLVDLYGKEQSKQMLKFAQNMEYLSRNPSSASLVAQGIAVNFIKNIGRLARLGILSRFLTSGPSLQKVNKAFQATKGQPIEERASIVSSVLRGLLRPIPQTTGQLASEELSDLEGQAKFFIENETDLGQQLSNLSQQIQNPNISSDLAQISPLQEPVNATGGLRQRAKTDPAVAQALGIQGSTAGLL